MRQRQPPPARSPPKAVPPHRVALVALSSLLAAKAEEGVGGARRGECCKRRHRRKARLTPAQLLLLLLGAHHGNAAIGATHAAGRPAGRATSSGRGAVSCALEVKSRPRTPCAGRASGQPLCQRGPPSKDARATHPACWKVVEMVACIVHSVRYDPSGLVQMLDEPNERRWLQVFAREIG